MIQLLGATVSLSVCVCVCSVVVALLACVRNIAFISRTIHFIWMVNEVNNKKSHRQNIWAPPKMWNNNIYSKFRFVADVPSNFGVESDHQKCIPHMHSHSNSHPRKSERKQSFIAALANGWRLRGINNKRNINNEYLSKREMIKYFFAFALLSVVAGWIVFCRANSLLFYSLTRNLTKTAKDMKFINLMFVHEFRRHRK